MYTQLGVLTKGTIIEVNVSELGLVTAGGKVRLILPSILLMEDCFQIFKPILIYL